MAEQVTNRTERAVKGAMVSFLQYGTQMLLQLFLAPLVLRMAGQETLGAYALLMQILGYLAMLDLGISVSLNVFMAKANGYDDHGKRLRDVMSTARTFLCFSNTIVAIFILLLSVKVELFFSSSPQTMNSVRYGILILAIWQMLKSPWSVYGIGLSATQNLAAYNFIGIVCNAARLFISLGLVASGFGLIGLIFANILAEALNQSLSAYHFRKLYPLNRPVWGIPNKALFREMLIFGLQSLLMNVAWRLVYLTDNIVVGYLYGAAAVSIYYSTQMPTTIAFNIVNRVHDNASPALNEIHARNEEDKLRKAFLNLHKVSNLLALPIAAGVLLLNKQLITLWVGPGQYAGDFMTTALAGFILLTTINHLSYIFFIASGRIIFYGFVGVIEGIVNLALSIWLGKIYGLAGVMWASVIANVPATALVLFISMRRLKISIAEYLTSCIFRSLLPTVISYFAGYLAGKFIPNRGWETFAVQGAVLLAVYFGLVYLLNLTRDERVWVNTQLCRLTHLKADVNPV